MKILPPGLQAHLDSGATTLCWCWRITCRSGESFGFTDHDRDLVFDDTTFEAATGFTASEIRDSVGLSVDNLEVDSALISDRLSEDRLAAGDFDDATVEILRINWMEPGQRVLMRAGSLGEVRRTATAFTAEVRGLAHYLQQTQGRVFQYGCDADLGDARCGIDLTLPGFCGEGQVISAPSARLIVAANLEPFADDWFTRGLLTFLTGDNTGRSSEIRRHRRTASETTVELWQPMSQAITPGDAFRLTPGCDKTLTICAAKFANVVNHRGFPHMPGNDFLASGTSSDSSVNTAIAP
jgi:uncharacterized phage protein (TIGR02218 family)